MHPDVKPKCNTPDDMIGDFSSDWKESSLVFAIFEPGVALRCLRYLETKMFNDICLINLKNT